MAVGLSGEFNPVPVAGIRLGSAPLGVRSDSRDDLTVIELAAESRTAAVFTRNAFCAAPVKVAAEHLSRRTPRYLLINAGNANAGTGYTIHSEVTIRLVIIIITATTYAPFMNASIPAIIDIKPAARTSVTIYIIAIQVAFAVSTPFFFK